MRHNDGSRWNSWSKPRTAIIQNALQMKQCEINIWQNRQWKHTNIPRKLHSYETSALKLSMRYLRLQYSNKWLTFRHTRTYTLSIVLHKILSTVFALSFWLNAAIFTTDCTLLVITSPVISKSTLLRRWMQNNIFLLSFSEMQLAIVGFPWMLHWCGESRSVWW